MLMLARIPSMQKHNFITIPSFIFSSNQRHKTIIYAYLSFIAQSNHNHQIKSYGCMLTFN